MRDTIGHVSEFKYLGCVLDESGTYEVECYWKVASGRRVAGVIRSLVYARGLQLAFSRNLCMYIYIGYTSTVLEQRTFRRMV